MEADYISFSLRNWEFLGAGERTLNEEKLEVFSIQHYRCFHTFVFLITFLKLAIWVFSQFLYSSV